MIEFTLIQENITKITFSGNNDEYVAGEFKASFDGSNNIVSTPTANAVKTVEITPAETSSFATGTKYYFVFLPGSFSKGYTLKFTRSDGYEATYKRETAFNFAVGTYYNMYNKDSGLSFSAPDPLSNATAVDLGLSVKWGSFNVGASSPEEYGDYFAWGETEPKTYYDLSTYKWCNGSSSTLTKYNGDSLNGIVDNRTILELSDDAARVNWGDKWRLPTDAEWTELRTQCEWTWTVQNGVNGYVVTSRTNGNSIFLPAAGYRFRDILYYAESWGYCWASSSFYAGLSCYVYFGSDEIGKGDLASRYKGLTVRPVFGDLIPVSEVRLNETELSLKEGEIEKLTATVLPENAAEKGVTWTSSKPSVASVDANGQIFANQTGETVITVTTADGGRTAECVVTVTAVPPVEPEALDLGLSVKWASFNVGASSPEEFGFYFAWGETSLKTYYDWSTYKWCNGSASTLTKYNNYNRYGTVDNRTLLELSDDAARVNWGDKWRMPTDAEWTELRTQCEWTWTVQNGVNGYVVTSRTNGNSIFLPVAGDRIYDHFYSDNSHPWGDYWSSSLKTDQPTNTWNVRLYEQSVIESVGIRAQGHTVRPVFGDHVAVLEVCLNKTDLSLTKGESGLLTMTFLPENAAEKGVVWSSSRPSIASVDSKGVVTAHEAGTAVITGITVDGGKTAQCAVTVTAVPSAEPEAVDLGLSVKWASFNVGASSPEGFGKYFAWGETEPKTKYDWSTYKWCNGSYNSLTKYNINSNYGAVDGKTVLDISDDAARANWGGSWRIPTYSEWKELITNCEWTWTTQDGVNGYEVTSRTNGNSIFLPATGCWDVDDFYHVGTYGNYWSTSLFSDDPRYACIMYFDFEARHPYPTTGSHRFEGITVRPVYGE